MTPFHRISVVSCALGTALLAAASASAESQVAQGQGAASASVHIRLHIPSSLRVVQNRFPERLVPGEQATQWAEQQLEVVSTLKHGFCVGLRGGHTAGTEWALHSTDPGVGVDRLGDGYRVCTHTPGRHRIALRHGFTGLQAPMAWPVQTELSAL